jgi:hypothetical protein
MLIIVSARGIKLHVAIVTCVTREETFFLKNLS